MGEEAKIIATRRRATEKVKCKDCGKELHYNGYLVYNLDGTLHERYYHCGCVNEKPAPNR